RGIEAYRAANADSVLGLGGGASLDMAKAIALLVNHPPPLEQYEDAKGGDALTHNLEAYVAKGDHPLADAIAVDGLRRIAGHLKRAVQNGKDIEAGEQMFAGAR